MKSRNLVKTILAVSLVLCLGLTAVADTIRLRDGTVIRGEIVSFKDQQFVVLIGAGGRGRRSRSTIYMEDVESIEFDGAPGSSGGGAAVAADDNPPAGGRINRDDSRRDTRDDTARDNARDDARPATGGEANRTTPNSPVFFPIRLRVRADNTANGWNDSGLMVRRGQRLRITATGRVALGGGLYATPAGLTRQADSDKLMRNENTGGLIAVIGDDNDDFIFVGSGRELIAQRDGRLFFGVNEGNLSDNSGTFDVTVEAEAVAGSRP